MENRGVVGIDGRNVFEERLAILRGILDVLERRRGIEKHREASGSIGKDREAYEGQSDFTYREEKRDREIEKQR